ncbi:hypothetical protein EAW55_04940 [Legionella jordanis]|nr:hypothetical protein EAW55_04940 [Legionella jordanis]
MLLKCVPLLRHNHVELGLRDWHSRFDLIIVQAYRQEYIAAGNDHFYTRNKLHEQMKPNTVRPHHVTQQGKPNWIRGY